MQHPDEQNEGGSAPLLTELPSRAVTSGKRAARPSSRLAADVSGPGSAVLCECVWERCDLAARRRGHLGQDCSPHDQDQHQKALAYTAAAALGVNCRAQAPAEGGVEALAGQDA